MEDKPLDKSRFHPLPARRRRAFLWPFVGGLIISAAAVSFFMFQPRQVLRIDPADAAQVAVGRRIYAQACASCHGASLEGQANWQRRLPNGRLPAPPHDSAGHTWHHPDEMLFKVTKYGPGAYPSGYQTDMPAFDKRLTDEEIAASLAFIKSTWPAEIRGKQARIDAAHREQR